MTEIYEEKIDDHHNLLIIAGTILAVAVVIGSVIVILYSTREDAITIVGLLLAFVTATLSSMYAAFKTSQTSNHVKDLTIAVNGRLSQLMESSKRADFAEGVAAGRTREEERVKNSE